MSNLDERLADLIAQWEEDVYDNEWAFSRKDSAKDEYGWLLSWQAKWRGEVIARCIAELRAALVSPDTETKR